jgi:hypothetical protein
MTDAAMPNLALMLHQMSLSAAIWRPSRPAERPRVVTRRADNVLHVDFGYSTTNFGSGGALVGNLRTATSASPSPCRT